MHSVLRGISAASSITGNAFSRRAPALFPMASSICTRTVQSRSIHFETKVNGVDQRNDITNPAAPQNHWFSEAHSLTEIYKFLDRLTGCSRNVYNITLGFRTANQMRGIKIGAPRRGNHRAVVVLSGHQAHEWTGVAVGLYLASNFARCPFNNVDVFIVPTVNPIQYDLHHQAKSIFSSISSPSSHTLPVSFSSAESDILATGPVKNFVDRLGKRFIRIVQDLETGTVRQISQGQGIVNNTSGLNFNPLFSSFSNCPTLGALGENCLMGPLPSYIIELRGQDKLLKEDQIVSRGEEILAGIRHLVGQGSSM